MLKNLRAHLAHGSEIKPERVPEYEEELMKRYALFAETERYSKQHPNDHYEWIKKIAKRLAPVCFNPFFNLFFLTDSTILYLHFVEQTFYVDLTDEAWLSLSKLHRLISLKREQLEVGGDVEDWSNTEKGVELMGILARIDRISQRNEAIYAVEAAELEMVKEEYQRAIREGNEEMCRYIEDVWEWSMAAPYNASDLERDLMEEEQEEEPEEPEKEEDEVASERNEKNDGPSQKEHVSDEGEEEEDEKEH